tara:strand:- start:371 stop:1015 length:645 start_codon:yes stop_codon:yes gene_type:complete
MGKTDIVAGSQATIVGAKEEAKAVARAVGEAKSAPLIAETKSSIAEAVILAESKAKETGAVLTDLSRATAALPALEVVTGQLKELAQVATSTLGGRIFDSAIKEIGLGSTEGATAKAKFVAIVNNQVLPLLKQTFGGAFTVAEGEALKATLGDPNSDPEEKSAQIDAFIDSKVREIETKERQLGVPQSPQAPAAGESSATDITLPNGIVVRRVQ